MAKYSNKKEIVRFIITGLVCALLDFGCSYGSLALLVKTGMPKEASNAISTLIGFIVGVILNYFMSTYWVFKNVDKNRNTKSPLFITVFVLLSAVAAGLSIGTMQLCGFVCQSAWNIDIINGADQIIQEIFQFNFWSDVRFWAYFVSFCLRTLVGLIWNYFTRKYILYKSTK